MSTSICLECEMSAGAHKLSCSRAARLTNPRNGPPFTVERYGSLGESIIAERDWLLAEIERLQATLNRQVQINNDLDKQITALTLKRTPSSEPEKAT
jgi:hypothetical protein